jgi:pSer/pThr/pTyr-binding forkhead associated (FHA) protein
MNRKAETAIDESLPALIVTYGNTPRKRIPLTKDILLIGQNRACDLNLVSPEVSPVHCIIVLRRDGWRLRDCGSRIGTRVNGKAVQEERLCDSDAIQVGPFSFQAHLPNGMFSAPAPVAVPVDEVLPRVQRSRRNLAQLALRLRRRLRIHAASNPAAVNQQTDSLREKERDCAARMKTIDEAGRHLAGERAKHEQELSAFIKRVAEWERQHAEQQVSLETSGAALVLANEMEAQRLAEWRRQLEEYAAQLERARKDIEVEEERLTKVREQIEHEKYALADRERRQRAMMEQAETSLREQRAALTRMVGELKQLHQEVRSRDAATLHLLRQQNEELRAALERCGAAV